MESQIYRTHDVYKAEDLTQEIVLNAYRSYSKLRDKSRIIPWLWGIARNVCLRSFAASAEILTDDILIIDIAGVSYETPENEYLKKYDIQKVRLAVSHLAKIYRDVCIMFYLEEKDYKTIAKELGIPLSSVKWRLNQSKSQLKEEMSRMEYMTHGYRKAIQLKFNMGGAVDKMVDPKLGFYDNADKALEGLLPQNICVVAYNTPKTVTEISSELGVAADYVEEALEKLVDTQSIRKLGNKYQTMFPIWDKVANEDIFDGNLKYAISESKYIIDMIYSMSDRIKALGFYGCDKDFDKLILFLIGYICLNTENNSFETDKLPFHGIEKAWYILATIEKEFNWRISNGNGINSCGSMFGFREFYFYQKFVPDNRSFATEEQKVIYNLYLGEPISDDYSLSRLIEIGKVVKHGNAYKIAGPVLSDERGDTKRLLEVLTPVFKITNTLQAKVLKRSCETVKKYIPKHLEDTVDFFGSYCSRILETALFEELMNRNIKITNDMVTWYTVK